MLNWIKKKLQSRLQYWLGIPVLFVELDKVCKRVTRLENKTRQGRGPALHERIETQQRKTRTPERYDEIQRRKKLQRKGAKA